MHRHFGLPAASLGPWTYLQPVHCCRLDCTYLHALRSDWIRSPPSFASAPCPEQNLQNPQVQADPYRHHSPIDMLHWVHPLILSSQELLHSWLQGCVLQHRHSASRQETAGCSPDSGRQDPGTNSSDLAPHVPKSRTS